MIISDFECVCAMLRVIDDVELSSAVCENWRSQIPIPNRVGFRTVWVTRSRDPLAGDARATRARVVWRCVVKSWVKKF